MKLRLFLATFLLASVPTCLALPILHNTLTLVVTAGGQVTNLALGNNQPPISTCSATTCMHIYTYDQDARTQVLLTATALTGYTFAGWSGACTGTDPCTVSMFQDQTVSATFTGSSPAIIPATGYWFNPAEGGRGYNIEQRGNNLFMAAFLYSVSGSTTWYGIGPGAMTGNTYTGSLETYSGGQTLTGAFQPASAGPSGGNFSIAFSSPTEATITWPGGMVPIQRYDFGPGGSGAAQPAGTPEAGWWWSPTEGGRGYAIEIQGGSLFLAGYMYDSLGNPVWYASGPTPMTSLTTYQGVWQQYGNGQTLTGTYKSPAIVNADVGNVTIQFTTTTTGTLTFPDGRQVAIQRYTF
jgi:uncharacterized repeat protein (TIGR02543 family)